MCRGQESLENRIPPLDGRESFNPSLLGCPSFESLRTSIRICSFGGRRRHSSQGSTPVSGTFPVSSSYSPRLVLGGSWLHLPRHNKVGRVCVMHTPTSPSLNPPRWESPYTHVCVRHPHLSGLPAHLALYRSGVRRD